jgi:arylsulfatase A-like enzyme
MTRVALVVLDTLRKDAFDDHFDWLPGTRFERARSTSHWTTPAHASLLTGLYPSEHGVHAKNQAFDVPGTTLVEHLSDAGYETAGFSANPNVTPAFDFDRGFDVFDGDTGLRSLSPRVFDWSAFTSKHTDEGPARYLRAVAACVRSDCATFNSLYRGVLLKLHDFGLWNPEDSGARVALRWLRQHDFTDDAFFFLNLMEAHDPYDRIPNAYRTDHDYSPPKNLGLQHAFDPPDSERVRTAYDDAVSYLSDVYRDIFAELRSEMDIVITVSDHGDLLGEYGLWGHTYGLHSEVTHVPLVLWKRNQDGIRQVDEQVSLLDVYATIADVTSVDIDGQGRTLLGKFESTPRLVEGHGLTDYRRRGLEAEGYNVDRYDAEFRGVAVPPDEYGHQTVDGWLIEHGDGERLRRELSRLEADLDERTDLDDIDLDEATLNHLRDLGYA